MWHDHVFHPRWVLDGHTPRPATDGDDWEAFMLDLDRRRVGLAHWGTPEGALLATVSTVFLGLDAGVTSPPRLFETMVFFPGHGLDDWQGRVATWEEAERQHKGLAALVRMAVGEEEGGV